MTLKFIDFKPKGRNLSERINIQEDNCLDANRDNNRGKRLLCLGDSTWKDIEIQQLC